MIELNSFFSAVLQEALETEIQIISSSAESGGCINNAIHLNTTEGHYFLKWNDRVPDDMFIKEANGLELLHRSGALKIPAPICQGKIGNKNYLLLEYIHSGKPSKQYWEELGHNLAQLHHDNTSTKYGLEYDNYIGKLYQKNKLYDTWIEFFVQNRLEVQLKLALENGEVDKQFAHRYRNFYKLLPSLLPDSASSLLHGDLWSGNVMVDSDGQACLFDPATYYGHREIELAFTHMFGGFGSGFYSAYQEAYPLDPGFEERIDIYNMYPSMVHVNLFGGSYLSGVERVLRRFV